jgi:2-hydroxy-3-keto-5-methylthiopentenyl-1-phosphate phosphatase
VCTIQKLAVLTDFDGTIVTSDTAESALSRFAGEGWRIIDEQFERGEISFEESLRKEFAMLKVTEGDILRYLDTVTHFRPNFETLVEYSKSRGFPVIVVSGGLDFCIRHFLEKKGLLKSVEICASNAKQTTNGFTLTFPTPYDKTSINLKDDLAKHCKQEGAKVVYIGNGVSDFPAAKIADIAFAVKNSTLARLCAQGGVSFTEMTDFQQVVDVFEEFVSSQ